MTYKELFYFTGHCLALDEHPSFREQVIKMIHAKNGDLENFIQLCSDHLIIPAIYLQFKKHDILACLPEDYIQALEEIYELNRQRNQQILKQIDDITATLNKENIQPVFLKGTANLLDGLYSDVGERMIGDIDFLVKEEDFLKTAEILLNNGYYDQLKIDGDEITTPAHHYSVLTKKDAPAPVEIHRVPVDVKYARQFTSEMIFRQRKKIEITENTYVPSDPHKLIHNFIHSQLSHNRHRQWMSSFRDLYDAKPLFKRTNLNEAIDAVEEKYKAQVFFYQVKRTFNLNNETAAINPSILKKYINQYDWWMNHPLLFNLYLRIHHIFHLIFNVYLKIFLFATFSKSHRKFIAIRAKALFRNK